MVRSGERTPTSLQFQRVAELRPCLTSLLAFKHGCCSYLKVWTAALGVCGKLWSACTFSLGTGPVTWPCRDRSPEPGAHDISTSYTSLYVAACIRRVCTTQRRYERSSYRLSTGVSAVATSSTDSRSVRLLLLCSTGLQLASNADHRKISWSS